MPFRRSTPRGPAHSAVHVDFRLPDKQSELFRRRVPQLAKQVVDLIVNVWR